MPYYSRQVKRDSTRADAKLVSPRHSVLHDSHDINSDDQANSFRMHRTRQRDVNGCVLIASA
ncbi:hypothetical protein PUN4_20007 [Paraburkholderia unamae]|nr:hypothetical protein PUN4_20007 [Paraburkholderia unamae]